MKILLVESPTKVKSIGKYLGSGYKVLATYGHVRDLPSKQGSVLPEEDFAFTWQLMDRGKKAMQELKKSLKGADTLILATDPDREGEAIAWHVLEALDIPKNFKGLQVQRISFNAITKNAILEAIKKPVKLNQDLVQAYLARLGLDYLVGFTLSPVLWRKLPGSRSAGRVQSVALRVVTDREHEIEAFTAREYWSIEGLFAPAAADSFEAQLCVLEGKKLEKFSLQSKAEADAAVKVCDASPYTVADIQKKRVQRNPQPPFITSTLQQEASRKLGFSASRTMRTAQRLYEGTELDGEVMGLITYMRTDSIHMTPEAIKECRAAIEKIYTKEYLADGVRTYKAKTKNAQEAHEAIRPLEFTREPSSLRHILEKDELALYTLIWQRAMASQMANALFDQLTLRLAHPEKAAEFKATGSVCVFPGFQKVYLEGQDDAPVKEEGKKTLPKLEVGAQVALQKLTPNQHFTQPPPRYTEASLIKKMEEIGIGRPSTYARILQVLQDRAYVRIEKRQMFAEERGMLVVTFLKNFFEKYVEYDFTANLENELDSVSRGEVAWKKVLGDFWTHFKSTIDASGEVSITTVLEHLEKDLEFHLFKGKERTCSECKEGKMSLRLGKFGPFLGCQNYPDCKNIQNLTAQSGDEASVGDGEDAGGKASFPRELGEDPELKLSVSVRLGPYGYYFQWGDGAKPKRVTLPKSMNPHEVTLEEALRLGALPKLIGAHPETGNDIVGGLGRFGPYVKYNDRFYSVKSLDILLEGDMPTILEVIARKDAAPPRKRTFSKAASKSPAKKAPAKARKKAPAKKPSTKAQKEK